MVWLVLDDTAPLALVVGRNCKRLRKQIGITQDELARYARDNGLRWRASVVGDFEAGRSAPTFATVLAVSLALEKAAQDARVRGAKSSVTITLDELVSFEGSIQINEDLALPSHLVAAVCRGKSWPVYVDGTDWSADSLRFQQDLMGESALTPSERVMVRSGLTEDRIARQLGIDRRRLADISYLLWQKTFSEERDLRAGSDANPQKKGRVSREMSAELERELSSGDR